MFDKDVQSLQVDQNNKTILSIYQHQNREKNGVTEF